MTDELHRPIRELLLGLAVVGISVGSILSLCWAFFILGDYGGRDRDPFPDFVQGAVAVSFVLTLIGAFAIGPFWRAAPAWLALIASTPYLLLTAFSLIEGGFEGVAIWCGAGSVAFLLFYGSTRLSHVRILSTVA